MIRDAPMTNPQIVGAILFTLWFRGVRGGSQKSSLVIANLSTQSSIVFGLRPLAEPI
jgi:hypothetical protein